MSVDMYDDGIQQITSVDVSEPVIAQMRERHKDKEGMAWLAMDARELKFEDGSFDVVLEKGLFDALFAGTASKAPPVLAEATRVLRSGGMLVSVSFSKTRIRDLFMSPDNEPTGLTCEIASELQYTSRDASKKTPIFLYICTTGG